MTIPPALILMLLWPGAWEADPPPSPPADPTVGPARDLAFRRAQGQFLAAARARQPPPRKPAS